MRTVAYGSMSGKPSTITSIAIAWRLLGRCGDHGDHTDARPGICARLRDRSSVAHRTCVSVGAPVESLYHWRGKIETAQSPGRRQNAAGAVPGSRSRNRSQHPYNFPKLSLSPLSKDLRRTCNGSRTRRRDEMECPVLAAVVFRPGTPGRILSPDGIVPRRAVRERLIRRRPTPSCSSPSGLSHFPSGDRRSTVEARFAIASLTSTAKLVRRRARHSSRRPRSPAGKDQARRVLRQRRNLGQLAVRLPGRCEGGPPLRSRQNPRLRGCGVCRHRCSASPWRCPLAAPGPASR